MLEQDQVLDLEKFGAQGDEEPDPEPETPAAPTLDGLDDATRAQVEAYYAAQEEARRQQMQQYGLDLAADGSPLIRDPQRFGQWAGPRSEPRQQPAAAPPAPAAAADEEPPALDPLTMSAEDLRRAIEWEAKKLVAPLVEQNRQMFAAMQRRSANDAFAGVRQSLEKYGSDIASVVDDPQFAEMYRLHAGSVRPEDLEIPAVQESLAMSIVPFILGQRRANPQQAAAPQPPQLERDQQGRYVARAEVARGLANRQTLDRVPPARGGTAPPSGADRDARVLGQFVTEFSKLHPTTEKFAAPNAAMLESLESESIEAFMEARKAAGGRR